MCLGSPTIDINLCSVLVKKALYIYIYIYIYILQKTQIKSQIGCTNLFHMLHHHNTIFSTILKNYCLKNLDNSFLSLWRQVANISLLLFNVANSGLNIMCHFSFKHGQHFFNTGLNGGALS